MAMYVTFFSAGKGTETLLIDDIDRSEELIVWDSKEQYFSSRGEFSETVIDGGEYSYGIAAATSAVPDDLIKGRIVSFYVQGPLLFNLRRLDLIVRELRNANWPDSLYDLAG